MCEGNGPGAYTLFPALCCKPRCARSPVKQMMQLCWGGFFANCISGQMTREFYRFFFWEEGEIWGIFRGTGEFGNLWGILGVLWAGVPDYIVSGDGSMS